MARPIETQSGDHANKTVCVRMDEATHKALRYLAVDNGTTVSTLLRMQAEKLTKQMESTAEGRTLANGLICKAR